VSVGELVGLAVSEGVGEGGGTYGARLEESMAAGSGIHSGLDVSGAH